MPAARCLLLVCWLSVSTMNSLFHSLADLLWPSCAISQVPRGRLGRRGRYTTARGWEHRHESPAKPEAGFFSCIRRPGLQSRPRGLRARYVDSDDMAVGMYPTFARCSSLTVSVCLQVSEFDSPNEWAHVRQNHSHGFATHRDRRAEANNRNQYGWVPILLPCSFSCTYIV